jgi:DNA helicase-2/ATP-dependent DNA helicase PcrA
MVSESVAPDASGCLVGSELVEHFGRVDAATNPADDQLAVVSCEAPALRVVAPAGSGKTRTMVVWAVDRARQLAEEGAEGRSVVAMSFTKRASAELSARVAAALRREGLDDDLVTVSTFHSFGARIVTEFGWILGIRSERNLLAEAAQRVIMERAFDRITLDADDHDTWFPRLLGHATKLAGALYEEDGWHSAPSSWQRSRVASLEPNLAGLRRVPSEVEVALSVARRRADLLAAAEAYREVKVEMGITDYGDLLTDVVRLVEQDEVRDALVARHPYLIVDEYQDTNVVQRRLLQRLHSTGKQQLVVVGDRAQAIYGFRGATVANFTDFESHFTGAETRELRNVYRHGSNVVAVAETVASKGHDWSFRETVAQTPEADITMRVFVHEEEEADWIVDEIAALAPRVAAGEMAWGDVGVLCRRWRELQSIAPRLRRHGIPVDVSTKGRLYDIPAYWDATAVIRLAVDPGDNVAAARLLLGPRYRLSERDLAAFADEADWISRDHRSRRHLAWNEDPGVRLIDALVSPAADATDDAKATALRFVDDVRRWIGLSHDLTVAEFLLAAWDDLGLGLALASSPDDLQSEAASVLGALLDLASGFVDVDGAGDLRSFLKLLDLSMDIGEPLDVEPPDLVDDAVRLLTIFSAKGLEFDHVFLMALNQWVLPGPDAFNTETDKNGVAQLPGGLTERSVVELTDPDSIAAHKAAVAQANDAESRRLFYVAATRARKRLALTASHWKRRASDGQPAKNPFAAPYLDELDDAGYDVRWPAEHEVPDDNPLSAAPVVGPDRWPPEDLELAVAQGVAAVEVFRSGNSDETELIGVVEAAARRIAASETAPPPPPPSPEFTVTDLVSVTRDRAEFVRQRVLRLPEPPSEARRRGTLVHQWIEERGWALQDGADADSVSTPWSAAGTREVPSALSAGAVVVDEDLGARAVLDDPPEPVEADAAADACAAAWLDSRFASLVPTAVELPVVLTVGGVYLKGKVDALYEHPDGIWEVVDIKTGPMPDESQWLQLEAYALALAGDGRRIDDCRLTFVSLHSDGGVVSRPARPEAELRDNIVAALNRVIEATGSAAEATR